MTRPEPNRVSIAAKSRLPSPSKSAAMGRENRPDNPAFAEFATSVKVAPVPLFSRTTYSLAFGEPAVVMMRSLVPSPLKSPATMPPSVAFGAPFASASTVKFAMRVNDPSPPPRYTRTVPSLVMAATSALPSPVRSAAVIAAPMFASVRLKNCRLIADGV